MVLILLGVAMFTLVVVSLVGLLIWVRARLVPAGEVLLLINDEPGRALRVPAGGTLLTALAEKQVFVPSGCGGKGTCGLCKLQVAGAGEALPTERGFLTRGELLRGSRLACQVKLKNDIRVQVPAESFNVRRWTCTVVSNASVADFLKELVLELPPGEEVRFSAGQYVQMRCPPHAVAYRDFDIPARFRGSWDRDNLWR
ncbi:MAG TPA: 2Fe-2S iron-sulfur cluster-binding protein, partial [Burkholderiales bacterium]|nr:2Fe-2S iron-sulfur cluster-binding protein [Burkholderiales bacterium]